MSFFIWITSELETQKCCYKEPVCCWKKLCFKSDLYRHIKYLIHGDKHRATGIFLYYLTKKDMSPSISQPVKSYEYYGHLNKECCVCYVELFPNTKVFITTECKHVSCLECFLLWENTREKDNLPL